ncbi:ubiquinone anaerobic biosynthesis accessory factor UbiT [Marinobacterium jannaschii]|uniref:ubiquinone anaerobic biosynthesis accessory factor UbiT n=1 Tax=Marinobacterium jannaschii TaxID=64970 RepID=UPI000686BDD7|nr:SCP2 sterol-binding domain-containing protein [Marinobacterium jannaschii]
MTIFTTPLTLPRPDLSSLKSHFATRVISKTESALPFRLKQTLLEKALNEAFQQPLADNEFYFLEGRQLGLEFSDLEIKIIISCEGERLIVCDGDQADAWIKGQARDFLQLANRELDPDTLFFQRRLLIEGNTELGLAVKNLLDSIDWDDLPKATRMGIEWLSRLPL